MGMTGAGILMAKRGCRALLSRHFSEAGSDGHVRFTSTVALLKLDSKSGTAAKRNCLSVISFVVQGYASMRQGLRRLFHHMTFGVYVNGDSSRFHGRNFLLATGK